MCPPRAALIGSTIADDVGDRDVGRRELLDVALLAVDPRDRRVVAGFRRSACAPYFEIGANGLSLTSLPATIGIASSSSVTSARRMRDFACPRRPSRMKLCRREERVDDLRHDRLFVADHALEQWPARASRARRFWRSSSLTERLARRGAERRALESAESRGMLLARQLVCSDLRLTQDGRAYFIAPVSSGLPTRGLASRRQGSRFAFEQPRSWGNADFADAADHANWSRWRELSSRRKKHCVLLLWRKDQCAKGNPQNPPNPRHPRSPLNVAARMQASDSMEPG